MPSKAPHSNGNEPVENGIRNTQDVEMKDDLKGKGKKTLKEGEDEMTVVVPPSKASKQSSAPPPVDADADVVMDNVDSTEEGGEVKVDPVVQTVSGTHLPSLSKPQRRK
jgi:26S proteasome regulatory subunit N3